MNTDTQSFPPKKISIVIPVFNESRTILDVLKQVDQATTSGLEKEIILIDDCSTDGTAGILLGLNPDKYKVLLHQKNTGKGAALRTGFEHATGDIIVVQDADLEYDPQDIENVIQPFLKGASVVYGSRYLKHDSALPFWHSFFNKMFTKFSNLFTGQKITDVMTCYKAFNQRSLKAVLPKLEAHRFGFEPEVTGKLKRAGFEIVEVPVSYRPRTAKEGKHMNLKGQLESLWAIFKYNVFK
jgi:glycosyltransferase involved in cell wall biosynthesis